LYNSTGFFLFAWAAHYFPFYLMGRQLFLHHYLPAHLASCLVVGALTQFLFSRGFDGPVSPGVVVRPATPQKSNVVKIVAVQRTQVHDETLLRIVGAVLVVSFAAGFMFFAPLTYGDPGCSVSRLVGMKWLDTWDFHFTK
jgi:dolichyl-phosphate-mannose-protein mannosyltransferase